MMFYIIYVNSLSVYIKPQVLKNTAQGHHLHCIYIPSSFHNIFSLRIYHLLLFCKLAAHPDQADS